MIAQRDQKVVQRRRRELPVRVSVTPEVVAVEVDGGRLRTRANDGGPGVHQPQNKEDKLACLVTLQSSVSEPDPQPEPPEMFREPRRVQRLVQQMKSWTANQLAEESSQAQEIAGEKPRSKKKQKDRSSPQLLVRSCVASMSDSESFGPMVAAEAQERGFYGAKRKAFVGDGASYNWSIHRGYFGEFEPITDLLHALCYLYTAASASSGTESECWSRYEKWLLECWQGRVSSVIGELKSIQERVGVPPEGEELDRKDVRRVVSESLGYLENNASRMDYPRYRRAGLPITSSLVESLVGEFNDRVKERRKFWNRSAGEARGAEVILQLRAAVLSQDERLERFLAQRPGNPHHRRKIA